MKNNTQHKSLSNYIIENFNNNKFTDKSTVNENLLKYNNVSSNKEISDYINEELYNKPQKIVQINELSSSSKSFLTSSGKNMGSLSGIISTVVDFVKNAFKNIKDWLKKQQSTNEEVKKVKEENKDVLDDDLFSNAIAKVMDKSGLSRSDKKKKDDKEADSYDKLNALVILIAAQLKQVWYENDYNALITAAINKMGKKDVDFVTDVLTLGAAAIKDDGEQGKTMFMTQNVGDFALAYGIYGMCDKEGIDQEKRDQIYQAAGIM